MDAHFFDRENFEHIKGALAKAIQREFSYEIGDQFDDNVISIMQYVFDRYRGPTDDLEEAINAMNRQVFSVIFARLKERLGGNPEELLEARRRERQELPPPPPQRGSRLEELHSEALIDDLPPMREGAGRRPSTEWGAGRRPSTEWGADLQPEEGAGRRPSTGLEEDDDLILPPLDVFHPVAEQRRPEFRRVEEWRYLLLDSQFRQGGTPGEFTVDFHESPLEVASIRLLDVTAPVQAPYLLLAIEQIRSNFIGDSLFAKLLPVAPGLFRPTSDAPYSFSFPQLLSALSLRLMTPDRQTVSLTDQYEIDRFEAGRDGVTRIVLKEPVPELEGSLVFRQSLKKDEVPMVRQEYTFRDTDRGVWIYGNYGAVEPGRGDFVHIVARSDGETERREHHYLPVLDGTESGALLVSSLDMRERIESLAIIERGENDLFSAEPVKTYRTSGGAIDKFEIPRPFDELMERDHLGKRWICLNSKQVSFTFQIASSSSSGGGADGAP